MKLIDFRSDTVTKPSEQMRKVMAEAEVGDDVYGEDPTVNKLEERTAEILGKEAALFVPSGTMSNQLAIKTLTVPGDEMLLEENSHCYYYESGAPAALSGVTCKLIRGNRGIFSDEDVKAALRPDNVHFPVTKLVCVENTHNRGGGTIWPIEAIEKVVGVAKEAKLKIHLDGARLWNASAATGIAEKEYAKYFDTVNVCFSKGLGAPVGSALASSAEVIKRARRFRKQFGGGMRQAGIIAAGALYALEKNRSRLTQDHENAKNLALQIAELSGIEIEPQNVQTNIIMIKVSSMPAEQLVEKLKSQGVLALAGASDAIRMVTNLHISKKDIDYTVSVFKKAVADK